MTLYILRNGEPVREPDVRKWAKNFESEDRHVALTEIGRARVSTVFLGLDHSWGSGTPILFETMIFGGKHNDYQERYCTLEESMLGHDRAVALVKSGLLARVLDLWERSGIPKRLGKKE